MTAWTYAVIGFSKLFSILRNFRIPDILIRMIEVTTGVSELRVKVERKLTDEFDVITALNNLKYLQVRQEDALSPMCLT